MDPLTDLLAGRRFSAVGIRHPDLTSVADFRSALGPHLGSTGAISLGGGQARLYGVEFLDSVPRYSTVDARVDGDSFGHDGYLAFTIADGISTAWVLSPFRRLLGKTVARLVRAVVGQSEAFVRPILAKAILAQSEGIRIPVAKNSRLCKVTQVTVRVQGDVGVQLVALSGQAPLQSTMLKTIEEKMVLINGRPRSLATPYALKFELPTESSRQVKFNLDRHGNFFWYQAEPNEVAAVVRFLQQLEVGSLLATSFRIPLEGRKQDDDDAADA